MLPVDSEEDLIAHTIEAAATIRQQPGIFACTHQSAVSSADIEVGGHTFKYLP